MVEAYFDNKNNNEIQLYKNIIALDSVELFHEAHSNKLAHPADILSDKMHNLTDKLQGIIKCSSDAEDNSEIQTLVFSFILEMDFFMIH